MTEVSPLHAGDLDGLHDLRPRDRRILLAARARLGGGGRRAGFVEVLEALRASVETQIPNGRVFHLGDGSLGPIFGSWISGVGITPGPVGVRLVRVTREGHVRDLGAVFP